MGFGQGIKPITHLRREDGVFVKVNKVEKKRRLALLLNSKGDAEYIISSLAQGTRLQIEKNLKCFWKGIIQCELRKTTEDINLTLVQHNDQNHLLVDLDQLKAVRASKEFKEKLFSATLLYQNKIVGFAFFLGQEVTLVSASNLMIAGTKNVLALTVHALEAEVCIVKPLVVTNALKIYSQKLLVSSEDNKPLITAGSFEVLIVKECNLDAIIEVLAGDCELKATDFKLKKPLEASHNVRCFAEKIEILTSVVANHRLEFHAKDLCALKSSQLHGQMISIIAAKSAGLAGITSAQGLEIFANQTTLSGKFFINGDIVLETQGADDFIEATKTAVFYYSGNFSTNRSNLAWFAGLLEHVPDLVVSPKVVLDPFQKLTELEEQRLLSKKRTPMPLGDYYGVRFLPKTPAGKPALYLTGVFGEKLPRLAGVEAHCDINAASVYVKGTMVVPAQVRLNASHTLSVNVQFSAYHFSVPALFLLQAEKYLECKDSSFNTLGRVMLSSKADLNLENSQIKAGTIGLQAENMNIAGSNCLSADKIAIQAKGKVKVKPEANLSLWSKQPAIIRCKDFESEGTLIFQDLMIKADGIITLYRANMSGSNLSLDCQYLLTGWSNFNVANKLLVTSFASFIVLSHIHAGFYINNSIFDFSTSLYTPALGDLSPRVGLSLLLAAANSGLSIAQMIMHDPLIQTSLALGRMAINTLPALFGTIQLANEIYKTASKLEDPSSIITLANLTKNLLYTLAGLGYSLSGLPSRLSFDAPTLVSLNHEDLLSTLNKINTATAPLIALIQRGRSANNFVSFDCDLELGLLSTSNTSFQNIDLSERLVQSTSRRSLLCMEPNPISFTLAPNSSESGLLDLSFSSPAILPFSANKQFLSIDAYSPLLLPQYMNIEANQLRCHGRQDFRHSSIAVQNLETRGAFRLEQGSALSAKTLTNTGGKAEIIQSTAQIKGWDNQNHAENYFTAANVSIDEMVLPNGTGAEAFATQLLVKKLSVEDRGLFAAGGHSAIEGDNFVFSPKAKIGSATSDWHVNKLSSASFNLEIDSIAAYKPSMKAAAFDYCSSSTLDAGLTPDGVFYFSSKPLNIENRDLVGLSNLSLVAPAIEVSGDNSASMSLEFDTSDLKFRKANNDFQGSMTVYADKVSEVNSNTKVQGNLVMQGNQLACNGGGFKAHGTMDLSFNDTKAAGTKTVVKEVKKHHSFFSTKTEDRETTYFKNLVFASDKHISMHGNLDFTGVDLEAPKLDLDRAHMVRFCPLQGENKHSTSHSNLFGSKRSEEKNQVESASHVQALNIDINTDILKIKGSDVLAQKVHLEAQRLEASASILKSSKKTSFLGLSLKANMPTFEQSPLYSLSRPLQKGSFVSDTLPGLVKHGAYATNMAGDLLKAAHKQSPRDALQTLTGFNPSLSVSLGKKTSYFEQEHQGSGALLADDLVLDVHTIECDNNYVVHVSNQAEITTDRLTARAANLHTRYTENQLSLVDNLSLSGNDWGLNWGHQYINEVQSQGEGLNFNQLTVHANELNLVGETLVFQGIQGNINHFITSPGVNSQQINATRGGIFTSGASNYQQVNMQSQSIANSAQSLSDIPRLHVASSQQNEVPIFDIKHSFGLSGSWEDLNPRSFMRHTNQRTSLFSLWDLQFSKDNSLTKRHHHFEFALPCYHVEAGHELVQNWHSLHTAAQNIQQTPKQHLLAGSTATLNHRQVGKNSTEKSPLYLSDDVLNFGLNLSSATSPRGQGESFVWSNESSQYPKISEQVGEKIEFDPREIGHWLSEKKENFSYSIAKINLLKSAAWGFYGLSAGLGCYALYHAENRVEEAGHIGFLLLAGSAGWELGIAAAAAATAPVTLPVELLLGVCGSIAVNIDANEVWDGYLEKIKENVAMDLTFRTL